MSDKKVLGDGKYVYVDEKGISICQIKTELKLINTKETVQGTRPSRKRNKTRRTDRLPGGMVCYFQHNCEGSQGHRSRLNENDGSRKTTRTNEAVIREELLLGLSLGKI